MEESVGGVGTIKQFLTYITSKTPDYVGSLESYTIEDFAGMRVKELQKLIKKIGGETNIVNKMLDKLETGIKML